MLLDDFMGLARAMVEAYVASGNLALPEGRRAEVVALLTRLMFNYELRQAYCELVTAERKRLGVHFDLLGRPDDDIPEREIASRGFDWLPDAKLADLAISASAIKALADALI